MKRKERIKELAHFFASYSLLGVTILLVLMLGFNVTMSEVISLALHGDRFVNISCIYMLASIILLPITMIVHVYLTMNLYYQRRGNGNYPIFVAFLMELMYVCQTLCWKPYKGMDLRWLIRFSQKSAHDKKIDVSRWFPRFAETILWWGIIAAVVFTILNPGNNEILLKIKQAPNQQAIIILSASFAIIIISSIIFGLLYHLFDHIRVKILNRNRYMEQSKHHNREISKPVGCTACGGPYPLCKDGCPLFDDE